MNDEAKMQAIDVLLSHVWMVRTYLKHSEEHEEDEDLQEVQRTLYDYMLALGGPLRQNDATGYLKQAKKKLRKLKAATELFTEVQPEISNHTSFQMAELSLRTSVAQVAAIIEGDAPTA